MQLILACDPVYQNKSNQERNQERGKVHLRWMVHSDLEDVLELEGRCFEYCWTKNDFVECLSRRNCAGMTAVKDGRVVGFMIYEVSKRRIELISLAIRPEEQRTGVGSTMVTRLIRKLQPNRRTKISITVRERNLTAQLFFRKLGFRANSIMRQFYEPAVEDAYIMQYRLKKNVESGQDSTELSRPVSLY